MYRFIRLSFTDVAKDENQLLKCMSNPYFTGAAMSPEGFSVKYEMQKCLCCNKVLPTPATTEDSVPDIMAWLLGEIHNPFFARTTIPYDKAQTCPECGALGVAQSQTAEVQSSESKTELIIKNEKTLCFNHRTGTCTAETFGGQAPVVCVVQPPDNTVGFSDWLLDDSPIKDALFRAFSRKFYFNTPAPELHFTSVLMNLILLNRFQGYEEHFYHAIPFFEGTTVLDDAFYESAKALRTKDSAIQLFSTLNLPDHKMIKKLFFTRPELMFFAKEIRSMPFKNTDILRRLYASAHIFSTLEAIRKYPAIVPCIEMFVHKFGETRTADLLIDDLNTFLSAAIESIISGNEISLSAGDLRAYIVCNNYNTLTHRTPLTKTAEIDGYTFFELRSTGEYAIASKELINCLDSPEYYYRTVVCAKKHGKYIAAIEVSSEGTVVQAYLKQNKEISTNPEFEAAFDKWLDYFGFSTAPSISFDADVNDMQFGDGIGDLPF